MFPRSIRGAGVTVALAAMTVIAFGAVPAVADEEQPTVTQASSEASETLTAGVLSNTMDNDGDEVVPEGLPANPPASAEEFSVSESLAAKALLVTYCTSYTNKRTSTGGAADYYRLPSTSSSSTNCTLESGVVSTGVWVLQLALNACYGRGLVTDGDFGPATYNALMYVQSLHGLAVDGIYGNQTRNNMRWPMTRSGANCTAGSNLIYN